MRVWSRVASIGSVPTYELSPSTCERLLRAGVFGRLAISTPSGPHVIPLNYATTDDAVVVRTASDGLVSRHAPGAVAAFGIDHVEYDGQRGWSVQARGPVDVVAAEELEDPTRVWLPRPWADGPRPLLLRLRWTELTGRRLGDGWDPLGRLPVRRAL